MNHLGSFWILSRLTLNDLYPILGKILDQLKYFSPWKIPVRMLKLAYHKKSSDLKIELSLQIILGAYLVYKVLNTLETCATSTTNKISIYVYCRFKGCIIIDEVLQGKISHLVAGQIVRSEKKSKI